MMLNVIVAAIEDLMTKDLTTNVRIPNRELNMKVLPLA